MGHQNNGFLFTGAAQGGYQISSVGSRTANKEVFVFEACCFESRSHGFGCLSGVAGGMGGVDFNEFFENFSRKRLITLGVRKKTTAQEHYNEHGWYGLHKIWVFKKA